MESWTGGKEMETDIVDALNNPQWPKAEVALGHGVWWKGIFNSKKFNTDKATLAVLYATVPLSYSDFHTAQYDAKALAACISLLPSAVVETPEDSNLESACHRLRNQISSAFSTLAYPPQYGQYTHKAVGLGRRALTVDEFTKLFAGGVSMRYEGKSQTQLTEAYAGYSLKALGTYEYLMLQEVADNPDYKEKELWCLTRPNAINLALGRNCEGERVNFPLQLPSWNSANNMYPCLGVFVAGDAGVVAYPSNLQTRNALPSVFFGECVFSNLLHEHYESSIFDAAIVDSAGASVVVQDAALMWQRVYASELSLESGACIARRQADPRKCEPLMMPISVFSKEVLPNIFCVETLCVARELKLAGNEGYEFDRSSWPFLFNTPHNMLMMLEAVGNKGDSCKAIGESMATEVSVRGMAKAMLNCLAPLYSYLEGKIRKEIRNDVEQQPVEYYGDTALWATLNALAPLELAYSKKPDVCFKNSVIISNAVKKASSCVALLENMKRDLDNNTLDTGIEKFLAHASVQLSKVEKSTPHLFRDSTLGILARNYVCSEVHTAQLNIRWANKDRNSGLATLASKKVEKSSPEHEPYAYKAMLKTGEVGGWNNYVGKKVVQEISVGLWNVETMSLLYSDAIRVVCLGSEMVDLVLAGQESRQINRERFVIWKSKQELVKEALQIVEKMKASLGPTNLIWNTLLRWQKNEVSVGIGEEAVREIVANAIVLGAVATGRLVETPSLTEHISIVRKYLSGENFLLWNGNAHYEVKGIPEKIDLPLELVVHCEACIGLRMVNDEFAKLLVKNMHGVVVSGVIDTPVANQLVMDRSDHTYTYVISPSSFRQYTHNQASEDVAATMLKSASKHQTLCRMKDHRLMVMVDEVRTYEEENAVKVISHVDEHGNLRLRISGKFANITTTATQGNVTIGAASLVGASGSRLAQQQVLTETNVDQEVVVTSLIALRTLLRNRAKSRESLCAVASAIIAQNIAANRKVRYRAGQNGCWGIAKRVKMEADGESSEDLKLPAEKGELILIDGPLSVRKGSAFHLSVPPKSGKPLLKIMIDHGLLIVLRGVRLVENRDNADVVRMHLPLDHGEAWFESYPCGMDTGDKFCGLPFTIEIGMTSASMNGHPNQERKEEGINI